MNHLFVAELNFFFILFFLLLPHTKSTHTHQGRCYLLLFFHCLSIVVFYVCLVPSCFDKIQRYLQNFRNIFHFPLFLINYFKYFVSRIKLLATIIYLPFNRLYNYFFFIPLQMSKKATAFKDLGKSSKGKQNEFKTCCKY